MTKFPPEAERLIDITTEDLLKALIAAYSAKHDSMQPTVVAMCVDPTEFDRESRWWVEPGAGKISYDQVDVKRYYALTNLPPDQAMLSLTVEGNKINLFFAPKIEQRITDKSKPKGFGR